MTGTSAPGARPSLTLVVLAAGLGSRFGGLKQLEAVGPGGSTLMDYTVYDAWCAGFSRAVFVIRPDTDVVFRAFIEPRFAGRITVDLAHQRLDDRPPGLTLPAARAKPWGTAHAVLAARDLVRGPLAVANADDFYGRPAFEALAAFLRTEAVGTPPAFAVAGYRLRDTVSAAGGVNRAVCRTTPDGWLTGIEEVVNIVRKGDGFTGRAGGCAAWLSGDEPVSMNLWAFGPDVFDVLRREFDAFARACDPATDEFLLPTALAAAVTEDAARVRVLDAASQWYGVTYREDQPRVERALRTLVDEGHYPERLWT